MTLYTVIQQLMLPYTILHTVIAIPGMYSTIFDLLRVNTLVTGFTLKGKI